jgi:hypothetical protein
MLIKSATTLVLVSLVSTGSDSLSTVTAEALDSARAKWSKVAPSHYEFSGRCRGWLLVKGHDRPWKIKVSGSRVVQVTGFDGFLELSIAPTMPQVFEAIGKVLESQKYAEGTVLVAAKFHTEMGYPERLYVEDTDMEDSWQECTIAYVRRLARPAPNTSSTAKDSMNYAPAEIYAKLRLQALGATAKGLGTKEQTFGVIMETGYPEAVVTLVALSDGTASLYFSNGGGMIGLGQHEGPAVAARSLISFADHNLKKLAPVSDTSLPRPGYTRFYVLTQSGTLTAEAKEMELGENRHVLSPLFYSAQDLITEMREVEEVQK